MKKVLFLLVLTAVAFTTAVSAQTYDNKYAKKFVLGDNSTPVVSLTLKTPSTITSAYSLTFPAAVGTSGQVLITTDALGTLGWTTPSSGTVTSVGLSLPSIFTVSNSPVTSSGTITATLATQTDNVVFAGPASGPSAAPTFRTLAATDIPNLDAAIITTGTLPVSRGGTGAATLTAHGVVIGNSTSAVAVTSAGTTGQILESGGASANPSFQSAPIGVYGDGSDGSITYDGTTTILGVAPVGGTTYTLTRDIFPSSMTVNNGITVITNGTRIYCTGTITNNGTIHNNGNNANNNTAGAATSAVNVLGNGQAGGNGGSTSAGVATVATANAGGGSGGVGGISGAGQAGGTVGGAVAPVALKGGASAYHSFFCANTGMLLNAASVLLTGGSGGSGGGGSAATNGGGGGGGGGVLLINAWKIDNTSGTISANGGNGGNGTGANGGSGGGGGGGLVLLIYHNYTGNAATATKGAAGTTKTGTGVLGSSGSDGHVVSIQN